MIHKLPSKALSFRGRGELDGKGSRLCGCFEDFWGSAQIK
jgi:hypothetical protein